MKEFIAWLLTILNIGSNLVNTPVLPITNPTQDFTFSEMTIPYLRQRQYNSSLSDLRPYDQNGSYASYLASYDSDGLNINGLLAIPVKNTPENGFPAVVFIHGYIPPTLYKTTEKYVSYVDYLARNGFVVFKIDLRGHGESDGEANGAYYSGDYIVDTLNAYSALQNADFVDPQKVSLWGHSMAGNVVMRSLVAKTDIPKTVIWAGAVYSYEDLGKYRLNDNSYRPPAGNTRRQEQRQKLRQDYGDFNVDSWFWKLVVPTNYLEGVSTKIQIHHAKDDNVVNVGYSRDLKNILEENRIENELFEYQTGGHNIASPSFNTAMQRTVEFLK